MTTTEGGAAVGVPLGHSLRLQRVGTAQRAVQWAVGHGFCGTRPHTFGGPPLPEVCATLPGEVYPLPSLQWQCSASPRMPVCVIHYQCHAVSALAPSGPPSCSHQCICVCAAVVHAWLRVAHRSRCPAAPPPTQTVLDAVTGQFPSGSVAADRRQDTTCPGPCRTHRGVSVAVSAGGGL